MADQLPAILDEKGVTQFPALISDELEVLAQARKLFDAGFYDHSLLDVWNASIIHRVLNDCA